MNKPLTVPATQLRDLAEPIEHNLAILIGALNAAEGELREKTPEYERALNTMRQQIAQIFESCGIMRAIAMGLYEDMEKPEGGKARRKEKAAE